MQVLSLVWGILALIGMLVGFMPCLGALNWLNIPFAGIGIILCAVALASSPPSAKSPSIAGLVCCAVALILGIIRLLLGGGVV